MFANIIVRIYPNIGLLLIKRKVNGGKCDMLIYSENHGMVLNYLDLIMMNTWRFLAYRMGNVLCIMDD